VDPPHNATTLTRRGSAASLSPSLGLHRYPPLSARQQQALFRRLRRPGTSAREREQLRSRLFVGTFQVVLSCLRRLSAHQRFAELVQEGALALAHALNLFTERDHQDFTRFAAVRVRKWLRSITRGWARERRLLVDQPIEALSDELISDPFATASQNEFDERLEMMLGRLPQVEQRVLRLRFGIGAREAQNREAIAKELRLQQHRVRYLEERGLLALRRDVERLRAAGESLISE
jgi:RNA polymerase sigma factor (sigma-70 family)